MKIVTGFVAGIALGLAWAAQANAASGHCSAEETVVFSCSVGKKTVSVCASADLSPTTGSLQYRFGALGANALEMTYPELSVRPASVIQAGALVYSGGGGAYMRFTKGDYAYVVYTGSGRGWDKEGVAIERNGKITTSFACKDEAVSIMGRDFFEKAGLPIDETNNFEMHDAH